MSCNICSVYGHWRTDDETAVILQSLSHFSDGLESRAVDLRRHAETRFHLRPLRKLGRNAVGRNRNRTESHFRGSFGAVSKAVAEIRSASSCRAAGTRQRRQTNKQTARWTASLRKAYLGNCSSVTPAHVAVGDLNGEIFVVDERPRAEHSTRLE